MGPVTINDYNYVGFTNCFGQFKPLLFIFISSSRKHHLFCMTYDKITKEGGGGSFDVVCFVVGFFQIMLTTIHLIFFSFR